MVLPGGLSVEIVLGPSGATGFPATLDFETRPTIQLTLLVTDPVVATMSDQCSVTVLVTNVNEAPVVPAGQVFTIPEAGATGASAASPATCAPTGGE